MRVRRQKKSSTSTDITEENNEITDKVSFDYFKPLYKMVNTYKYNSKTIALLFTLLALIILVIRFKTVIMDLFKREDPEDIYSKAIKKGVTYAELYELISSLGSGQDMKSIVENSVKNKALRDYLLNLIDHVDKGYQNGKNKRVKIDRKRIQEIKNLVNKDVKWN
jgi:hypothetical protein